MSIKGLNGVSTLSARAPQTEESEYLPGESYCASRRAGLQTAVRARAALLAHPRAASFKLPRPYVILAPLFQPTHRPHGLQTAAFDRMKLHKLALAAFVALPLAAACNSTQTAENSNSNARPAAAAATATPRPAATPDELAAAAADYSQSCIKCHKADGTGGTVELDEGETIKVPSLREHGLKDSDAHLAKQIAEGGDEMPPFKKRLDQQRIDNLVRYIRREFHGRSAGPAPAAATPAQPSH